MRNNNVKNTLKFAQNMQSVINGMYNIFESTFENEYPKETDGVTHYDVGNKCCFQVSRQYERPYEFLQSLLDILRVIYEPHPPGTFFFNSNPSFLLEAIPAEPFQLAYGSFISKPQQTFKQFWCDDILKSLEEYGYNQNYTSVIFVVVSTGQKRYGFELINEVLETLNTGFSPEEAFGLLLSEMNPEFPKPEKEVFAGYCLVPELKDRLRVSLWMFNKEQA